ncbi:hypothetical protein Tco_1182173 [Tanacetum coccineum]
MTPKDLPDPFDELDNVVEEEDEEQIRFLGGNSSSGTKKYRGSNSSEGGNIGDGVKIAGEIIGSGDEIKCLTAPAEAGKNNHMRTEGKVKIFIEEKASSISEVERIGRRHRSDNNPICTNGYVYFTLIREAQEEEISPTILEAAKTLSKVASQGVSKEKLTDKGKRYRRRARSMAKKIDIGLDAKEEINIGREEINTGIKDVNTGSTKVDSGTASKRGQREGKAPMIEEDIQATHKTKEQMRQEEAGLEEAIKLQAQLDEEVAKQIHLDKMDAIKAKLEANAELSNDVLGKDLPEQDFAKRMAEMVNQRKKHFAEERAKAKRNKPMTQPQNKVAEVKEEMTVKNEQEKEESKKARKEAMNPTPLTIKSDSVANWKIFQQGQRSVYQIKRANGADTVYMSFGAMIIDFTREDLIELYRTMFDPPLIEDVIWSLPLQQKMVSWRYYDKCEVHCLTLEACTIYMLADRKYPLSKEACQVMLKMKLLDGKMNEVCYKLLKMIEKQAGIRK